MSGKPIVVADPDDDMDDVALEKQELPEALFPKLQESMWGWQLGATVGDHGDNNSE